MSYTLIIYILAAVMATDFCNHTLKPTTWPRHLTVILVAITWPVFAVLSACRVASYHLKNAVK